MMLTPTQEYLIFQDCMQASQLNTYTFYTCCTKTWQLS